MPEAPLFLSAERVDEVQTLRSPSVYHGQMSVAHFLRTRSDPEPIDPNPITESFMIVVPLIELPAHGGWLDGRRVSLPAHPRGSIGYVDWRQCWVAGLHQPFETMNFFVPQTAFDALTENFGGQRIERLSCSPTIQSEIDPQALGLADAILQVLIRPHEASRLFADHIFNAMTLHLAVRYGGLQVPERRRGGRLSGWQERVAKEMMLDDLASDISVEEIAAACSLSTRHFERAFHRSFGHPPHRWRMRQRVQRARELLAASRLPLSAVAQACGFADQSHLTRVFAAVTGLTPAAYRRTYLI